MDMKNNSTMKTNRYNTFALCLAASCFSFYNLMIFTLMNVLSVYLINDLKFTSAQVGIIGSWDLWGNVLGFIPIGMLLDRISMRRIGILLLSVAICATAVMSLATEMWQFSVLRCLQGVVSAGSLLLMMRVGTNLSHHHINKVIGLMILVAITGGIAGNSLFAFLAINFGWQSALLGMAGIGCISLFIMYFTLYGDTHKKIPSSLIYPKLTKSILCNGGQIGLLNAPVIVLGSLFGNHYLMQYQHMNLQQAASVSSVMFTGIMLGSPLLGFLADKWGAFKLLLMAYFIIFITITWLLIGTSHNYYMLVSMFFLMGIASCTQNLVYPLIAKSHNQSRSSATGLASVISNGLGAIFQALSGYLI